MPLERSDILQSAMSEANVMDTKKYKINIEEFWCSYDVNRAAKTNIGTGLAITKVVRGNQRITVEDYVQQIYEERGFTVVRGNDFYTFLMFCCGYFDFRGGLERFSDDPEIRKNYHGDLGMHASLAHHYPNIIEPNDENIAICKAGIRSDNYRILIKNASQIYNEPDKPKQYFCDHRSFEKILSFINSLEEHEILSLLNFCNNRGRFINGVSDFFVWNLETREWQFVEVKSHSDSLKLEQIEFLSGITAQVGNVFTLAFVLPSNQEELQQDRIADALYSFVAKDLKKLSQIGGNLAWEGYSRAESKSLFAIKECGVNPNSLFFFLAKTKEITPAYDPGFLIFAGKVIPLEKCLERLELEWSKLPRKQK